MKVYKVFISHSWNHVDDLKKLRTLLEKKGYFNIEFTEVAPMHPINSENSTYIKGQLKHKIIESDIVLGIAGVYASYSEWMKWELSTAVNNGKNVVGVIPRGAQRISTTIKEYSSTNVNWNTDSIVSAIRQYSK